ncbi:MAG: hypothetical protein FJ279_02075 [Planctomycetes bacterium]|nr:hypothetical protein [Planctomycetota bacterium]
MRRSYRQGIWTALAAAAFALLPAGDLLADVIELKDGGKVNAKIVKRGGLQLTVETDGIQLLVPEDIVKTVNGEKLPPDYAGIYEQKRQSAGRDAEEHYRLALWCRQHKLEDEAKAELLQVVKLDPKHEDARDLLGHAFYKNAWHTPEQLKAKGLVQYQGQWLTPDEAKAVRGKVYYMGQWLTDKEKDYLEDRQFSKFCSPWKTLDVADLERDIRMLSFVNQWGLSKEELRGVYDALMDAERDKVKFMTKRHELNAKVERHFLELKETIMDGVIDSYDTPKDVEGRASTALGDLKKLARGYSYCMVKHSKRVLDAVSDKHREDFYYGFCGCCHCSRHIPSDAFESKTFKEKYCVRCHKDGVPTGPMDKAKAPAPVSQSTLDLLEKARCCGEAEFKEMVKRLPGAKRAKAGTTSKMEDVLRKARQCSDTEFERDKHILGRQLEGMSEYDALMAERAKLGRGFNKFFANVNLREMIANYMFSDSFRDAIAARLQVRPKPLAYKDERKEEDVQSLTALMLDKEAFERKATETIEKKCAICHDTSVINKPGRDIGAWRGCLRTMQRVSWNVTDNDVALLAEYLSQRSQKELAEFQAPK